MKSSTALPVRTTFLHILYPNGVPIFDQMVLKAVGAWREGGNHDIRVLRQYIPHAWALADKCGRRPSGAATRNSRRTRSRVLWKSHGHNIPPACLGFIEALVRNFEQIKGC
jgi:hypothetical protein